jgi:hypothetical protein
MPPLSFYTKTTPKENSQRRKIKICVVRRKKTIVVNLLSNNDLRRFRAAKTFCNRVAEKSYLESDRDVSHPPERCPVPLWSDWVNDLSL